jgi:hypothetical protein
MEAQVSCLLHGKKRRARCSTGLHEQCFAAHVVHVLSTIYCSILLTTVNNVGSKTLFNPVFISIASTCAFLRVQLNIAAIFE